MPMASRVRALKLSILSLLIMLMPLYGLAAEYKTLVVYTYDSFISEWGAGPKIAPLFEKATGIKVKFVSKGDGGQLLSSLILEKDRSEADIALGLDNFLEPKALSTDLFRAYKPAGYAAIPASLKLDPSNRLIPYDYGNFAIVWDSAKLPTPPASLEDLTKPEYAKKLILLDPRTSTPGLGFLAKDGWVNAWIVRVFWFMFKLLLMLLQLIILEMT